MDQGGYKQRHTLQQPALLQDTGKRQTPCPPPRSGCTHSAASPCLTTPTSCPKQGGALGVNAETTSPLFLPHTSPFLTPPSLLPSSSLVDPPPVSLHCWVFAFSTREVNVSVRATETEGGGEKGGVRLSRKQTLGMDLQRICPLVDLTSFSETLLSLPAWNPTWICCHTLSTDHAHYVFNNSILCKTG